MAVTKTWGHGQGELGTPWWQDTQFKLGGASLSDLLCVTGLTSENNILCSWKLSEEHGLQLPSPHEGSMWGNACVNKLSGVIHKGRGPLSFTNLQGSASMAKRACAQQTQAILHFQFCTRTARKWFILESFTTKRATRNNQDWRLGDTASPLGLLSQQVIIVV